MIDAKVITSTQTNILVVTTSSSEEEDECRKMEIHQKVGSGISKSIGSESSDIQQHQETAHRSPTQTPHAPPHTTVYTLCECTHHK